MKILIHNIALVLSALTLGLALVAHFALGTEPAKFVADLAVLGVAAYHALNYLPAALRGIGRGGASGVDRLNIHLWLGWMAYFVQRDWVIATSMLGRPDWMIQSPFPTLIATTIFIAGMFGVSAPVSDRIALPRRETAIMMVSIAFAFTVVGIAIGVFVIAGHLPT